MKGRSFVSPFATVVLLGVTALLTCAALPMSAQNTVPATAVEAAKMPQYAKRLALPAHPASRHATAPAHHGASPPSYSNGPIDGNTSAWTINFGFVVADSFPGDGGQISSLSFGAWLFPGDTLSSVEVSITSSPFGGTTYFDRVLNVAQEGCFGNQYGFNVCTEVSESFNGPTLQPGTYWVNLQNASVSSGDPVYWDENSGPSLAEENSVGTIPSESFSVEGIGGSPQCFQSQGNLQIIHDFTPQQAEPRGVAIDEAGNLYGTTPASGDNGAGFAYKLSHFADWLLDPIFNFPGGDTGGQPSGVIVGPNGSLYGSAQGGIQNCGVDGSQYCGLIFNLRPQPTFCPASLCSWNENIIYRFSSESDGSGVINVSAQDQQGNLYGTTSTGGAHGAGTVFELARSGASWTKTTLYSFSGGNDGSTPTEVLLGNDGDLYGVAGGGGFNAGVVFQLVPSGGQWIEHLIHTFEDVYDPSHLVQDAAGNLYGIAKNGLYAPIFVLEKSSGWAYSEYYPSHTCEPRDLPYTDLYDLTINAAGELYGIGTGGETYRGSPGTRREPGGECFYNFIFKASYDGGTWQYQDRYFVLDTYFGSSDRLAFDTNGTLYGTTQGCGAYNSGTVWQLLP